MKKSIAWTLVLFLSSGLVLAKSFDTGYEPEGLKELKKQQGVFSTVLVNPDVDFSKFGRVHLQPVALVIRDPGTANQFSTGRLHNKREKVSVIPEYEEVVEFKRIVGESIATELDEKTDLEVVEAAEPGTLILQPVVTDVEISTSSKNTDPSGRELPELEEGTVVFDLMDAETGRIVARFAEKRRNRPPKDERVSEGLWPNLPRWAVTAASDLASEITHLTDSTQQS